MTVYRNSWLATFFFYRYPNSGVRRSLLPSPSACVVVGGVGGVPPAKRRRVGLGANENVEQHLSLGTPLLQGSLALRDRFCRVCAGLCSKVR